MDFDSVDKLVEYLHYHPEKYPSNTDNMYQRLELPDFVSVTEVKKKYLWGGISKKWDPADKPPKSKNFFEQQFNAVVDAYKILSSKHNKAFYDSWLKKHGSGKTFNESTKNLTKVVFDYMTVAKSFEKVGRDNHNFGLLMTSLFGITLAQSLPDIGDNFKMVVDGCVLFTEAASASMAFYYSAIQRREANRHYHVAAYYSGKDLGIDIPIYEKVLLRLSDSIHNFKTKIAASKVYSQN